MRRTLLNILILALGVTVLSACGNRAGENELPSRFSDPSTNPNILETENTIWSLFNRRSDENIVLVNRYLWTASLEVLNFLPVQTVDPYTGVIVTGYGTPPGGGRAYRATVLIDDPALDARSLNVALQTSGGPVSPATVRAIEDAILTRARQLRVADDRL